MTTGSHSATILIVDDTPANLGVIVEALEDHGLRVVVAQQGEEALQRAEYVRPDLVLLDVMMPGMNGFEICRALKARASTSDIPVIFMTSLSSLEDKITGFAVGAVDYVIKPLQVQEVQARIDTHLTLRAMRQQLEAQNEQLAERTAQLQVSNEELEAFNYCVSHDLRAPLRAMAGFAQVLIEGHSANLDPGGLRYLDNMILAVRRMEHLIQDLLNYARTGRGTMHALPVPLAPLLQQLETTFSARFAAAGASFEVVTPLATPLGDATLIEQILTNLIDNALKYRRRDGVAAVRLAAIVADENVLLQVSDNGIGIARADWDRIFQMFQRGHTERDYSGTGIGLAIVAKAARAMGGDVSVESSPGQGSTFSVRLPAALATERMAEA